MTRSMMSARERSSGERVALGGGEPVLGDAREIVACRNDVLHESLRHAAGVREDEERIA
jgi:hypothetical protein